MAIQLTNGNVLRSANDALVLERGMIYEGIDERFIYRADHNGSYGRIFTDIPALGDHQPDEKQMPEDFIRELLLFADQKNIRNIQIPLFGIEVFASHDQPIVSCFRYLSDIIQEAMAGTSVEEVYITLDNDKNDMLCDEMEGLIEEINDLVDELHDKWACDETEEIDGSRRAVCDVEAYHVPKNIMNMQDTFGICLDRLMMERNLKPGAFVRRANISRQTLSKLRNRDAVPEKYTALACAVALELSYEETEALLKTAGYCLSDSITLDVIVGYFIKKHMYDIDAINIVLYSNSLRQLGARQLHRK